jgi:hypothetical protein
MDQETQNYCTQLVRELIDGIDAGDFTKEIIPDKYRWEHMLGLYYLKDELDGGEQLFQNIYETAISSGERYLRQKAERGERIQIAFQTYSAAQWPAEGVYRSFEKMANVDVKVVVSPLVDRDAESMIDTYRQTSRWFHEHLYRVIDGLDIDQSAIGDWSYLGGYPDVLYQVSSWFNCLPRVQWFTMLPLRCLVAYIPYGISQADSKDGQYSITDVYNHDITNFLWRLYCDSQTVYNGYQKHQFLKAINVRRSGYAKMDYFYKEHQFDGAALRKLWSIPDDKDVKQMKKIIVAPHYTVFQESDICYSTFQKNMWFWLYLIKKYENQITFLFKPHPNLRRSAVAVGLFKDYEEYDKYIQAWNDSVNATVVQEGNYLEHFATSDAMIMDSGSFLGEYLYTQKPLLYLTRPEQTFSDAGWNLMRAHYKAPGEDYIAIENFIEDVVLGENDTMAEQRKKVFEEEYDYLKLNGQLASDFIVNEVKELIS